MFGFPSLFSLPFTVGGMVPSDDAASLARRNATADKRKAAIKGFVNGMPAPGQELGAGYRSTPALLRSGVEWLQKNADPNPQSYNRGASGWDEAGFLPRVPTPPLPAPSPVPSSGAAGPSASGPSLPQGFPGTPPTLGPLSAPLLNGSTGGWPANGASTTNPTAFPTGPSSPGQTASPPGLYNGPGSAAFGAGDQAPGLGIGGGGQGFSLANFLKGDNNAYADQGPELPKGLNSNFTLANFLKGGDAAKSALADAPNAPVWNIARFLGGGGFGGFG